MGWGGREEEFGGISNFFERDEGPRFLTGGRGDAIFFLLLKRKHLLYLFKFKINLSLIIFEKGCKLVSFTNFHECIFKGTPSFVRY